MNNLLFRWVHHMFSKTHTQLLFCPNFEYYQHLWPIMTSIGATCLWRNSMDLICFTLSLCRNLFPANLVAAAFRSVSAGSSPHHTVQTPSLLPVCCFSLSPPPVCLSAAHCSSEFISPTRRPLLRVHFLAGALRAF